MLTRRIKFYFSQKYVNIIFKNKDGTLNPIKAPIGQNLL
jgi:hypothetical protein